MAIININTRFTAIKALSCASLLAVTLTACGPVTTDAQAAWEACRGVVNPIIHDQCMANYVNTLQAGRDFQTGAIGASMLSHPIRYR